jgi:hypothetical protein
MMPNLSRAISDPLVWVRGERDFSKRASRMLSS